MAQTENSTKDRRSSLYSPSKEAESARVIENGEYTYRMHELLVHEPKQNRLRSEFS